MMYLSIRPLLHCEETIRSNNEVIGKGHLKTLESAKQVLDDKSFKEQFRKKALRKDSKYPGKAA